MWAIEMSEKSATEPGVPNLAATTRGVREAAGRRERAAPVSTAATDASLFDKDAEWLIEIPPGRRRAARKELPRDPLPGRPHRAAITGRAPPARKDGTPP